jgi:hypothetical protein
MEFFAMLHGRRLLAPWLALSGLLACRSLPPDERAPQKEELNVGFARRPPVVGEVAPPFALPDPDGRRHSLEDLIGSRRLLVLDFVNYT